MKTLYRFLFAVLLTALSALTACTRNQNGPEPGTGSLPIAGEWTPAKDPFHIVLKSENGKVNLPDIGEVDDATLTLMIKMMLAQEFRPDGMRVTVTENKDSERNAHIDVLYEGELLSADAKYTEGYLTVDLDGSWIDGGNTAYTVTAHVLQQTADDLTLYLDKEQLTELIAAAGSLPAAVSDEADITDYYQVIEIGIRLVRDGRS